MKPPDDAGDGRRAEDPGAGDIEDDAGDPALQAMRAVWLTMRDEAPSDRGLGDLLAAARAKADDMRPRPTVWQRLLAAMRRPQMLALATLVVVVGGAALVGHRLLEEAPPARTVAGGEVQGQTAAAPAQLPSPRGGAGSASDRATPSDPGARLANPTGADEGARLPSGDDTPVRLDIRRTPAEPAPAERPTTTTGNAAVKQSVAPVRAESPARRPASPKAPPRIALEAPPPPPAPAPDRPAPGHADSAPPGGTDAASAPAGRRRRGGSFAGSAGPRGTGAASPAEPVGGVERDEATAPDRAEPPAKEDDARPPAAPAGDAAPTRAQLAWLRRQCEAAANRGDCADVRRLVEKIQQADAAYADRVAKEASVAKCLAKE